MHQYDIYPLWTPDGKRIAFASTRGGRYRCLLEGSRWHGKGRTSRFGRRTEVILPWSWSSDGKTLVLMERSDLTGAVSLDIGALSMEGDRK